ncbi:hypothetical protein ACIBQX_25510 [Nonomuraea sp. NPDC049714]|uniref:hypothetical protein n=1 Tax=Nonomuraea sp. NPDC049714 TaxID=3364357 RepID=UPI0037BD6D15
MFDIAWIDLISLTAVKGHDLESVRRIIGAESEPVSIYDARLNSSAPPEDAMISEWGDGILVCQPGFGTKCAKPETLAALATAGRSVMTTCWHDRSISPAYPEGDDLLALAVDGRLLSALDPSNLQQQRFGYDTSALDPYLAGTRFDYETIAVWSQAGQTIGDGADGSITVAHWRYACLSALERFMQAELHEDLVRSVVPGRNFFLSDSLPEPPMPVSEFLNCSRGG